MTAVRSPRGGATAPRIAVLLPCLNEETTVADVVAEFRRVLPAAEIYVYDNGSTDRTADCAQVAGARVRTEPRRGKGNVVRRMFADVEADIYVMADGDGTYDGEAVPALIDRLSRERLDMVVGARVPEADAYRPGHMFGNSFFNTVVTLLFGRGFTDVLSGLRVFSRRFVKSFPALSEGFEIETELSVHALELSMPVTEVAVAYRGRPRGSQSKLSTLGDGIRILRTVVLLCKEVQPLWFFGSIAALLVVASSGLAWPLIDTYLATGLVPRFPTAILVTGMMVLASLSLACGLILDSVARGRREIKRLRYLELTPPPEHVKALSRSG